MHVRCRIVRHERRGLIQFLLTLLWAGVSCVVFTGCFGGSPNGNRVAVSGTVTRDGKPLDKATITFTPEGGATGVGSGGGIKNGRYEIPAESGPTPGVKYNVRIETIVGIPTEKIPRDQWKGSEKFERTAEIPPKGSQELNFTVE